MLISHAFLFILQVWVDAQLYLYIEHLAFGQLLVDKNSSDGFI